MDTSFNQEFFDVIKDTQYFNDNGYLDLEYFCVVLSKCFAADGILETSPQPRAMYDLLILYIQDHADTFSDNFTLQMEKWVQFVELKDWTPMFSDFYPDRYRTVIHMGGLINVFSHWIYGIGHDLMKLPEPDTSTKYYDWVRPEWVHVYQFIDGFHNALFEFVKKFDRKYSSERGYSMLEALHKSLKSDIGFDGAVDSLKNRDNAYKDALDRIQKAIVDGYHLEAITLQESLISHCLFNYLAVKKEGKQTDTLYEMLKILLRKKSSLRSDYRPLFEDVDTWRKSRNLAIHGFIRSKTEELHSSLEDFSDFSKNTAKEGESLCQRIVEWYKNEAVEFMETKFPRSQDHFIH